MHSTKFKSRSEKFSFFVKMFIGVILFIILGSVFLNLQNQYKVDVTRNCKVIDLQQQQLIKNNGGNMETQIRYVVVTDKETFICENSLLNGKFNNSDIFFRLKKDSTYNFRVAGSGKSILFDYRNILEVVR